MTIKGLFRAIAAPILRELEGHRLRRCGINFPYPKNLLQRELIAYHAKVKVQSDRLVWSMRMDRNRSVYSWTQKRKDLGRLRGSAIIQDQEA